MVELKQKLLIYLLCLVLFSSIAGFPSLASAAGTSMQSYGGSRATVPYTEIEDELRYFRMIGDLLIGRPLLLAATGVGTGIFLASLPFSILGGNVKEAANTLVIGPARQTFIRCLGCRISALGSDQHTKDLNTPKERKPLTKEDTPHMHTDKTKPSEDIAPKK
jgi:hypothetical protein